MRLALFAGTATVLLGLTACDQVTSVLPSLDAGMGSTGWTVLSAGTKNLNAVSGVSDTAVWVVGDQGTIEYWDGTTLHVEPSGTTVTLRGVWAVSPDIVYAVGDSGTILSRVNGVWSRVGAKTTPQVLTAVWADTTRVFAVGSNGTIVSGTAAGVYTVVPSTFTENLFAVTGAPNGGVVTAVGALGLALQINGMSVSRVTIPSFSSLLSGATTGATSAYFVGQQGAVFQSSASGLTPILGCPQSALRAVSDSTGPDVWAVGWDGTICRITGTTGFSYPYSDARWFNGVYQASPTALWVVGASGTLLHGYPSTPDGGAMPAPIKDAATEGG